MRRKRKNPLLTRIIVFTIVLHAIALPILAHFGALKKVQMQYLETRLVTLPPPPKEEVKHEPKAPKKVVKRVQRTARREPSASRSSRETAHHPAMNIPKVIAGSGGPGGAEGEPSVEANGTGKVGQVPTEARPSTAPPTPTPTTPTTAPAPPPAPAPSAPPSPQPHPNPPPPPAATVAQAPIQREPAFTQAEPVDSPQPSIPDDLRGQDLDTTFVAEFAVGADGNPTSVKVVQSTDNDELDQVAMETARKWRFRPATRDGQPVESIVRLHIEFQVSG